MRQMSLSDWIELNGVPTISRMLNVTPNTVRYWRIGESLPKASQMRQIKKLSNGLVGYEQIIDMQPKKRK